MPLSVSVKQFAIKAPLAALALLLLLFSLSCGKRKPPLPPEERVMQRAAAADVEALGRHQRVAQRLLGELHRQARLDARGPLLEDADAKCTER